MIGETSEGFRKDLKIIISKEESDVEDAGLKRFGFAPGNYIFHCVDCSTEENSNQFRFGDKRAIRCKEHALEKLTSEFFTDTNI